MYKTRIRVTRAAAGPPFLAINWKGGSGMVDVRKGWMIQPARRIHRGHWHYELPIAGPFRTKKAAKEFKKLLMDSGWQRTFNWDDSRRRDER